MDSVLSQICAERHWNITNIDGVPYLEIRGQQVRYYNYPSEKYDTAVRKMILNNTLAELRIIFPEGTFVDSCDTVRLQEHMDALVQQRGSIANRKLEYQIAATSTQLAIVLLRESLDKHSQGLSNEELQHQASIFLGTAECFIEVSKMPLYNRQLAMSEDVHKKILQTIRRLGDSKIALSDIISDWYEDIANTKQAICETAGKLKPYLPPESYSVLDNYTQACCDLVDARKNEPEYQAALKKEGTTHKNMLDALQRAPNLRGEAGTKDYLNSMHWLSIVRYAPEATASIAHSK